MSGPNPKVSSLSVTAVAVAAVQVGALFVAISEQTAFSGPRLDRFLNSFVMIGVLWTAVALVDLFRFPTIQMTRLVAGRSFTTAAVITAVQAVFQMAIAIFGDSAGTLLHQIAGLGTSFILYWALISLWDLLREPRASNQPPSPVESPVDTASAR